MKLPIGQDIELTYCLNVHPGATSAECRNATLVRAPLVFRYFWQLTGIEGPYAVGLWISGESAKELWDEGKIEEFAKQLEDAGLYCFTLNGFPYGKFHGTRVKDEVYLPDWSDPERLAHTQRLASCLAYLLPTGGHGTISTVPIGYAEHLTPDLIDKAVDHLVDMIVALKHIHDDTGKLIQLALEPEPDCLLEDLSSAVAFYQNHIRGRAQQLLSKRLAGAENPCEIMDRYLGLCLDLIHVGVAFEDPEETLRSLVEAGIPIVKVQLGAALKSRKSGVSPCGLKQFVDDTYLHQTRVRTDGKVQRYADLPDALAAEPQGDWRVHYHVPVVWEGNQELESTRDGVTPRFFASAFQEAGVHHFEVETYTLELFPDKTEKDEMILARELAWIYKRMVDVAEL